MADTLSWDLTVNDRSNRGLDSFESSLDGVKDKAKTVAKGIGTAIGTAGAVGAGLLAKGWADNMNLEVGRQKLAAQLDLSGADSEKAGRVAGSVYANNWGESTEAVNDALKSVSQNLGSVGDTSEAQLGRSTTAALALADVFDVDVSESTKAASALIKNGLAKNADEAFDMVTKGFQSGLDKSEDFTDTLNEYSPVFHKLGFEGKDMLDILSAGLKGGARDTDTVADAFKELSIRAVDGSKTTNDGFKSLGMSAAGMGKAFAAGGEKARIATTDTIQALLKVKDPVERNRIGVELFGTQWEDTVRNILPQLGNFEGAVGDVDGATQKMADTVGDTAAGKIETAKRKFEQWTQSMASSDSQMGLVVTGFTQMGGGALDMVGSLGMGIAAIRGTALAEKSMAAASALASAGLRAVKFAVIAATGPVGLIIIGVAALTAGLIVAYKKSSTFRNFVNSAFASAASAVLRSISRMLRAFEGLFSALGHLPGKAGKAFRSAASSAATARARVDGLRMSINKVKSKRVIISVDVEQRTHISQMVSDHLSGGGVAAGHRADGGPVTKGEAYVVGERRPELFVPTQNGVIIPRIPTGTAGSRYIGSSGGLTINVYVQNTMASKRDIREAVVEAFRSAPAGAKKLPASAIGHSPTQLGAASRNGR